MIDSFGLDLKNNPRYKTNYTLLMPTLCLIDGPIHDRNTVYNNPSLVDKSFPLGGLTMYLTSHMLSYGGLCKDPNSFKKYRNYKVEEIKNETLSYVVGGIFSRFAINPHFYLREVWKEYRFAAYISSSVLIASLQY